MPCPICGGPRDEEFVRAILKTMKLEWERGYVVRASVDLLPTPGKHLTVAVEFPKGIPVKTDNPLANPGVDKPGRAG